LNIQSLSAALGATSYPGRGIVLGKHPDGRYALLYFIMGRSENSRNRIFAATDDGIRTRAFDETKMTDPSLVIYHPVRQLDLSAASGELSAASGELSTASGDLSAASGELSATSGERLHIVTNGDQTDTIRDFLAAGDTFEDALRTRTFEPDAPHYTPRISGLLDPAGDKYQLSILKTNNGDPASAQRLFFAYDAPKAGEGHFIHTYAGDSDPYPRRAGSLPSFRGDPELVAIPELGINALAAVAWESLDAENRVALFVRLVDANGRVEDRIINKC